MDRSYRKAELRERGEWEEKVLGSFAVTIKHLRSSQTSSENITAKFFTYSFETVLGVGDKKRAMGYNNKTSWLECEGNSRVF